jgi:hypothetical protein
MGPSVPTTPSGLLLPPPTSDPLEAHPKSHDAQDQQHRPDRDKGPFAVLRGQDDQSYRQDDLDGETGPRKRTTPFAHTQTLMPAQYTNNRCPGGTGRPVVMCERLGWMDGWV